MQETLGARDAGIGVKRGRRHELHHLGMFGRRLEILAHGQKIDVGRTHVVHHLMHLQPLLAQPQHDARLGEDRRIELLDRFQQAQRRVIARARPDGWIEARHGFKIVIVDVGARRNDHFDRPLMLVAEIGRQNFDGRVRRRAAQSFDHLDELAGAAIGQIVAIDRGNDDMLQPHFSAGIRQILRLIGVDLARHAGLDVAEGTGAGAHVPQDHDRRMLFGPAFADIGTGRFLANRRQLLFPHQLAGLIIALAGRGFHADPVGLAGAFGLGRRGNGGQLVHGHQIAMPGRSCQCRVCQAHRRHDRLCRNAGGLSPLPRNRLGAAARPLG
ncbi:hypothetical protein SKA58_09466 [Sphingomonas sp. SKA58]|nr:hypothetical protein SKA58_09466 [Sphingomonas sp. SKA58]